MIRSALSSIHFCARRRTRPRPSKPSSFHPGWAARPRAASVCRSPGAEHGNRGDQLAGRRVLDRDRGGRRATVGFGWTSARSRSPSLPPCRCRGFGLTLTEARLAGQSCIRPRSRRCGRTGRMRDSRAGGPVAVDLAFELALVDAIGAQLVATVRRPSPAPRRRRPPGETARRRWRRRRTQPPRSRCPRAAARRAEGRSGPRARTATGRR